MHGVFLSILKGQMTLVTGRFTVYGLVQEVLLKKWLLTDTCPLSERHQRAKGASYMSEFLSDRKPLL